MSHVYSKSSESIKVIFTLIYSKTVQAQWSSSNSTTLLPFCPFFLPLSISLSISLSERHVLSLDLLWCFCTLFCKEKSDLVWLMATFTDYYSYIIYHRETEMGWEIESLSPTSKRFKCCMFTHTHTHANTKKVSCIRPLILKDAELNTTRLSKEQKQKCTKQVYPGPNPNITAGVKTL